MRWFVSAAIAMVEGAVSASRVRGLFKMCLRLHRSLPHAMRSIGDAYVREEFRRHKDVKGEEAKVFLQAWTKYAVTLRTQLDAKGQQNTFGEGLSSSLLDALSEEQITQLYSLYEEIHKDK